MPVAQPGPPEHGEPSVDRSDQPPPPDTTRVHRSPVPAYVVVVAAVLVVGVGVVASLSGETGEDGPAAAATDAPVAAGTPHATPRPSPRPTPTPIPTLTAQPAPAGQVGMVPTGVLVADTGEPEIGNLVADPDGTVWASRAGGVINFDPQTGRAREWTLGDDQAFLTSYLVPAREGGVWLVGPGAIRRFDGTRFSAVIETPGPIWFMVEDAGGGLWAQMEGYGLVRWADGIWSSDPPGRPSREVRSLVVDRAGRIWTANVDESSSYFEASQGVSVWDGSTWTTFDPDAMSSIRRRTDPPSLLAGEDGSVWAFTETQLERFRAGGWTSHQVADLGVGFSLSAVGPGGRLWFVRDQCDSCAIELAAVDGSSVTRFDDADGLPGAGDVDWPWAQVLAGSEYTLAATQAGLYRLAGGTWEPVELSVTVSAGTGSDLPRGVTSLAAVSRDEVWAVGSPNGSPERADGLFRFDGDAWRRGLPPTDAIVGQVALAPDGAIWVATSSGPLVHRGGSWTDLGDMVGAVVPDGEDDAGECGGAVFIGADGVTYYAGPGSGHRVVMLRSSGESWEAGLHPAPALDQWCYRTIVATSDGSIWALERGWGNTLRRSSGGPWAEVPPPDTDQPGWVELAAIAVDLDGGLWAVTVRGDEPDGVPHVHLVERVGDEWVLRRVWNGGWVGAVALLPEGDVIAIGDGILRLHELGSSWSLRGSWFNAVSVAPDGTVWVAGPNVYRLPAWQPSADSPPAE